MFELAPSAAGGGSWDERVVYSFQGVGDGAFPLTTPVIGPSGVLYGTTANNYGTDGGSGYGTIFTLTPPVSVGGAWTETVLYSFSGEADGAYPTALLTGVGTGGSLFGTTAFGGNGSGYTGLGTVFQLNP